MEVKKFLDQEGLSYLWKKLSLQDYPNNDTLVAIINAIDENKLDKSTAIAILENAVAGQVPVVKSVDENGKPLEWEAGDVATKSEVSALQDAINILNGTGEGSVQDTVTDAIANVVANAPEELDTLKEIADWIANDETGTVNLIERVEKAEEEIEALKPLDVQPDWDQTDETAMDFIKNKPDEEDALAVLAEIGFIEPVASADGSVFTDSNGALYSL